MEIEGKRYREDKERRGQEKEIGKESERERERERERDQSLTSLDKAAGRLYSHHFLQTTWPSSFSKPINTYITCKEHGNEDKT